MERLSSIGKRPAGWVILRLLGIALLVVGIVTAALNTTFGGFAPILWFLSGIAAFTIVICNEVFRIAAFLESKK